MLLIMENNQENIIDLEEDEQPKKPMFIVKRHDQTRHKKNKLFSNYDLSEEDMQSALYQEYCKQKKLEQCKKFLREKKEELGEENFPDWAEYERLWLKEVKRQVNKNFRNTHSLDEQRRNYIRNHTLSELRKKENQLNKKGKNLLKKNRTSVNKGTKKYRQKKKDAENRIGNIEIEINPVNFNPSNVGTMQEPKTRKKLGNKRCFPLEYYQLEQMEKEVQKNVIKYCLPNSKGKQKGKGK